ncbi:MAG: Tad domain-containing protein [Bacillota bacterium]
MMKVKNDERGFALLFTVLTISILLLFAGLATDFARLWVAREDLRTAVDAAALAGSLEAQRMVKITVGQGEWVCTTSADGVVSCSCEWKPPRTMTGAEAHLIDRGGWRQHRCDYFLGIERRWIEYPASARTVAQETLDVNWPRFMRPEAGGAKTSESVEIFRSGSQYPSVRVRAAGTMDTTLLKVAGIESLAAADCGQAGTFYERIEGGRKQGENPPPGDACP